MRVGGSSVGGEAGQFHTTRWTLVIALAHDQSQTGRAGFGRPLQDLLVPAVRFCPPTRTFTA